MKGLLKKHLMIILFLLIITIPISNTIVNEEKNIIREAYFIIKGEKYDNTNVIINESGIPIVDYGYVKGVFIGKQINPVTVSQKALYYESEYQKGNESYKQLFLNNADLLVENAVQYDNYTLWQYNFPWPEYNMTSPWTSAMAQGEGIQVLIRAYNITKDEKYLNSARLALNSFYVDVKDGGITYKSQNGWWYEEYVTGTDLQPRPLNGMIFALFGIYEYYEFTGDKDAKYLFDQGIIALKRDIYKYDAGDWTYYDALGTPAYKSYNRIHIDQLSQLYEMTEDPVFKEYYEKFRKYDQNPINNIKHKNLDFFVYILNFAFLLVIFEVMASDIFRKQVDRMIKNKKINK